ncbi:hypothetical protein [Roseomonas indoligenes]|uniref:Uncharacterized protein n=1 Tax=Roseomonas indoligenes TaxID=2820811 RepID=A0A940MR20_9PROT|nr:hypothetical protein [Pararoseomonas indoligenes]MBP0491899.1 hypothetical protein [Pararoseomonas indoligenes]
MNRRLLLAGCFILPIAAGALAQAEADRQLNAAIARLRTALGPDAQVEWRERQVDPVTGAARLAGVTVRQGPNRLTMEEVTLNGLAEDRVAAATASGVRLEEAKRGDAPGPMVATLGRVTLAGLVLPPGAPGKPVDWSAAAIESGQAEGLRVEATGRGEAALGRLSVSGYAPGRLGEAVLEGLTFVDRSKGETRMALGRARLAGAVVPRIGAEVDPWALAADAALLEGVELKVEKENVAIRMGRVQADAWGEGRNTNLIAEGLRVEGSSTETGPFAADLGRLRVAGVPLRDMAHAYAKDVNPPQPVQGQDQSGELQGLTVSSRGTPLVRVGEMRVTSGWDPAAPSTQVSALAVEGIGFNLPDEFGGAWLADLGFKEVLARIAMVAKLTPEGQMTANPFAIEAANMGRLGISMDVRGVEVPKAGAPNPTADDPFALIANWSIAAFSIRYTEDGLLRAVLAQQAAQERVPERQLRERYATMALRTPMPGSGPKEPLELRRMREALASFARDLGSIEIALRPAKPVPMMEMVGAAGLPPERMVRDLGLSITAAPPRPTMTTPPSSIVIPTPRP